MRSYAGKRSVLKTFRALKETGEFRRRYLTFLKSFEDQDIVREIGFGEATGSPLSLKQLFGQGIGTAATVQRRLARLIGLGIVEQSRSSSDKRVRVLTLSPVARKLYMQWGRRQKKSWK